VDEEMRRLIKDFLNGLVDIAYKYAKEYIDGIDSYAPNGGASQPEEAMKEMNEQHEGFEVEDYDDVYFEEAEEFYEDQEDEYIEEDYDDYYPEDYYSGVSGDCDCEDIWDLGRPECAEKCRDSFHYD